MALLGRTLWSSVDYRWETHSERCR